MTPRIGLPRCFPSGPEAHRPDLGEHELEGLSLGGLETTLAMPRWDVCFDLGRCPPFAVPRSTVLITHAHMDHAGGIAYHCAMRDLLHLPPPTYVVPRENVEDFEALLAVWRRLDRSKLPCSVVPLSPGETYSLSRDRRVRAFRSPHRVPCQGYALISERQRLLPSLVGKPETEIRDLRLSGTPVSTTVERIDVAFCGDTVIDVVNNEALVRTARLLILEVTFLDERVGVVAARSKGHVHLDEVIERAALFENEHIVFTHFSQRYTPAEVRAIVHARLPPSLRSRVTVLC